MQNADSQLTAAPGQENQDGRSMSQDPRPVMEMQNADAELKFVEF